MKNNKNKKNKLKIAIIICSILIIFLLLLLLFLRFFIKEKEDTEIITKQEIEESVTNYVRNKGEKERMQVYLSEYLQHIERKEYSEAYKKLYPQFKENYFLTEKEYISYVENTYSNLMIVEYENIERQGNYFIITALITNLGELETQITQKFIIYENGLNDYVLSFQAK